MRHKNKESLDKLIDFISEISEDNENDWFVEKLSLVVANKLNSDKKNINGIYEYCVKEIIRDQAVKFYSDFKLSEIEVSS